MALSDPAAPWREGAPAPHLAAYVRSYVGYRIERDAPRLHRGLPASTLTWIVGIGAPIEVVEQTDRTQPPDRYHAVLSGLQVTSATIVEPTVSEGVAIELTPLGLRRLVGVPSRALWNATFESADVLGPLGAELWERLQAPASWEMRFAMCDDVIGRLAGDHDASPELAHAYDVLCRTGGQVPIAELAARVGWTRQHLGHRFRDEMGWSPKSAAGVVRFERARTMLRSRSAVRGLAAVAAECGYADQSHLHRDFSRFAGCSPTRWMAEEDLPFVQSSGPLTVAG